MTTNQGIGSIKQSAGQCTVMIEIPKGSNIKYEYDTESGFILVDRKLFTAMYYPCNYGFIPNTLEKDGDPLDVLVLGETPLAPLSLIKVIPVGVLQTEDEEGQDSKIVAIPTSKIDPSFSTVQDIEDVPQHLKDQIKHFFEHYKELEKGKFVKISGWEGKESAARKITDAISSYQKVSES
ncbi:MAG: inorganic diphosphatase [Nitrososphaeraceae archaeon]|nr:inorganic diphosphatase [Nitrososphaeraceae archaeon]MDW0141590.1 inorganic diphosphatase [Nitrososphaeraceae archaeon]